MPDDPRDLDLLTIRQLKQVAEAQPQPYRIHAQVDTVTQKDTQRGKMPLLLFWSAVTLRSPA